MTAARKQNVACDSGSSERRSLRFTFQVALIYALGFRTISILPDVALMSAVCMTELVFLAHLLLSQRATAHPLLTSR